MIQQNAKTMMKLLALLLAMTMLLTACGGADEESSSSAASKTVSETIESEDASDASKTDSSKKQSTASGKKSSTAATSANNGGTDSGKYVWGTDPYANIPDSVKSKEIHVLMWRDFNAVEKELVEGFTKKTGIKIRTTVSTEYSTKLLSLISGKDSPDVVAMETYDFPSYVVRALQPLSTKTFRLDDACWDKTYMDVMKVNGKYYGVGISGSWTVDDCAYVTYYSPDVLKQCGVSATPAELYQQGNWNWETQHNIALQIKQTNPNYIGISLQNPDLFMLSAGVDFVSYDGSKFSNLLGAVEGNSLLTQAWREASSLYSTGLATEYNLTAVQQGTCGLFSSITYAMLKDSGGFTGKNFEAVPCAGPSQSTAYTPARPKLWGVARGAKNVEGAAYFIRYFTDPNNCNMSNSFANKQFEETFKLITSSQAKKKPLMGWGITNYNTDGEYWKFIYELTTTTEANITTALNAKKGTLDAAINRANKDLARLK